MKLNNQIYEKGLAKFSTDQGLRIFPLLLDWDRSKGVSLMNPSIYNDDGKLKCNIRLVNYNMSHSEYAKYPHWSGPLQYIHPENDVKLATQNLIVEIDENFNITSGNYVEMLNLHKPNWEFEGLEDGRLVRWEGNLYLIGVRRDIKNNGEGRMEMSYLDDRTFRELGRSRIPTPNYKESYCEKNWMPILDRPFSFVKWSSPTEIAFYDGLTATTRSIITGEIPVTRDIRGGSQVIKWKDYYVAFGHSVDLWKPYSGEKASKYYTHLIVWDNNFKPIYISDPFSFTDIHIEFCCGLCEFNGLHYVSFSTRDNSAYILEIDLESILGEEIRKFENNKDHRNICKLFYDWIDDQKGIQSNLNLAENLFKSRQYSSSITHYLRIAEEAPENEFQLKYHCLCMVSLCYELLGNRWFGARQYSRFAKTEQPDRPEAYSMLCRQWVGELRYKKVEYQFDWIQVFENAKIGLLWSQVRDYPKSNYYGGPLELTAYYILSMDRIGKVVEAKELIKETDFSEADNRSKDIVIDVCNSLEIMSQFNDYDRVKDKIGLDSKFADEFIKDNHSQIFQDVFAAISTERCDGTYLEIGSGTPIHHNNSLMLENIGWKGISIEGQEGYVRYFRNIRKNPVQWADAKKVQYYDLVMDSLCPDEGNELVIDYLSLDVDDDNLDVLYLIPFNAIKFRCITFEHDRYRVGDRVRDESREYLKSLGYTLVGEDLKYNTTNPYEDWYIHPDLVKDKRILSNIYKLTKYVQSI